MNDASSGPPDDPVKTPGLSRMPKSPLPPPLTMIVTEREGDELERKPFPQVHFKRLGNDAGHTAHLIRRRADNDDARPLFLLTRR
jgi:hypothetical protein